MKSTYTILVLLAVLGISFLTGDAVLADYEGYTVSKCEEDFIEHLPERQECLEAVAAAATAQQQSNNLSGAGSWGLPQVQADQGTIEGLLATVFIITGALATVFIIIGGLRYVLAAGSPEGLQKAKNTILYAIVGLLISVFAFVIVNFVISAL